MTLVNPKGCPFLSIAKAIINAYREDINDGMTQELCSQMDCELWNDDRMTCGIKANEPMTPNSERLEKQRSGK